MDPHDHDSHPHGLEHDLKRLETTIRRRKALVWLAGAGAGGVAALVGCGGGSSADASTTTASSSGSTSTSTSTTTTTTTGSSVASCNVIPEETAGPFPADGSNVSNGGTSDALMLSGIVRSDIRSSIAGATGVAAGVPLRVQLQLVNVNASCADLSGYAIYIWHCDRNGNYSLYSSGVTNENYLRGVQPTDSDGIASFTTIFPACYSGRMPHIHIEVYRTETTATSYGNALRTTQLAFPVDVCNTVYSTASGYAQSVTNFARISFATDMVFSDGLTTQLATLTGSVAAGYVATLVVGLSV